MERPPRAALGPGLSAEGTTCCPVGTSSSLTGGSAPGTCVCFDTPAPRWSAEGTEGGQRREEGWAAGTETPPPAPRQNKRNVETLISGPRKDVLKPRVSPLGTFLSCCLVCEKAVGSGELALSERQDEEGSRQLLAFVLGLWVRGWFPYRLFTRMCPPKRHTGVCKQGEFLWGLKKGNLETQIQANPKGERIRGF